MFDSLTTSTPASVSLVSEIDHLDAALAGIQAYLSHPDFRQGFEWGGETTPDIIEAGLFPTTAQGVVQFIQHELNPSALQREAEFDALYHLSPMSLPQRVGFIVGRLVAAFAFTEVAMETETDRKAAVAPVKQVIALGTYWE